MSLTKTEMLSKIEEMLEKDIPVIMSVSSNTPNIITGNVKIKLYSQRKKGDIYYNDNINELYQYYLDPNIKHETKEHYMVITGVIKDDIRTSEKVMLRVSSWGRTYYIDYEEYREYIDNVGGKWTSSIVYIR